MEQCPICESFKSNSMCDCGYGFEKKEILDKDRIRSHLAQFSRSNQWIEKVRLIKSIYEIQSKKGHTMRGMAELIDQSIAPISTDSSLAVALDYYPELLKCKNKSRAQKLLKDIERGIEKKSNEVKFENEEALKNYMVKNWKTIPLSKDWNLEKKEYDTKEIGKIDLLAKHKKEPKWLVIELKIEQSNDEAVGQLLRYMGWVKHNPDSDNQEVEGLIISKDTIPPNQQILYALSCTSNIRLQLYKFNL